MNTKTLIANFEKTSCKSTKIPTFTKADAMARPLSKPVDPDIEKLLFEIDKLSDRILKMINTANMVKKFDVKYHMLSVLLTFITDVKCSSIDFVEFTGFNDHLYRGIGIWCVNEHFIVDGANIFSELVSIDFATSGPSIESYIELPSKEVLEAFVKDFDIIEKFFYDYIECLSKGDIFKDRYLKGHTGNTIWRVPAGSSVKEYYYDARKTPKILKSTIK